MKSYILIICFILLFIACSKKDDDFIDLVDNTRIVNDTLRFYGDSNTTWLIISKSIWFTELQEKEDTSGYRAWSEVFLVISGSTNANTLTVRNIGTGLFHEENVLLDENGCFYDDTTSISKGFCSYPPFQDFQQGTIIKAYGLIDTLTIEFISGQLEYF